MSFMKKLFNFNEVKPLPKSNKIAIWVIIVAICFLFLSGKGEKKENIRENKADVNTDVELTNNTEEKLKNILEKIEGAGDVDVLIYYSSLGEKIVASDIKKRSEKTEKGDGAYEITEDDEKSTVIYGNSSDEKPFITEEKTPKPGGVIVIAEGAGNEKVSYELKEAVKALLGIPPNRIKVAVKRKI